MRKLRAFSLVSLAVVAGIPVIVACSKDKPPDTAQNTGNCPPGSPPGYPGCPPGGGTPTTPMTGPTGPMTGPTGPTTTAPAGSSAGNPWDPLLKGAASLLQPGGLTVDLAEAGVKAQQPRYAPGMSPEGSVIKQGFTEGQHVEQMVPMQAGKCYVIIAHSPVGGVSDVGITLYGPPLYNVSAGASSGASNTAVIGGGNPMCPVIPIPVSYKLDIVARRGAGAIAVQVYSKTK